jgi:predicted metal-dependent hydrolase
VVAAKAGNALSIEYTVRRSSKAKRVRVNVHAGAEVEVVLPQSAPERAAAAAVRELRPWIERRLAEATAAHEQVSQRNGTLPYLGTTLRLVRERERTIARRDGELLRVPHADAQTAIERFYKREARREVSSRLDNATALAGTPYSGLSIRGQRTRWASCSATGRMSFNWRLLLAPERVLDYVVWHEVCHLSIRDHSPRFWALVERHWPTWRAERDWLRRNGGTLVLDVPERGVR